MKLNFWPFKRRIKVTILFKSGNKVVLRPYSFSATTQGGQLMSIKWEGVNLMFIKLSEIEAIIE